MLRFALACLVLVGCAHAPNTASVGTPSRITAKDARQKLTALSKNTVQLWVVVHVRAHKTLLPDGTVNENQLIADAVANADAAIHGGADAILLINARCEMPLYERVIAAVREKHPTFPLGISALSYGPENLTEGFRLAQKFDAKMVWCEVVPNEPFEYEDDDGSYKPAETTSLALALQTQSAQKPDAMHVAGVHMKYTRVTNGLSFEDSLAAALGTVDGINVTGPQTGTLADVERIKVARQIAGDYPLGLASGVSVENVASVIALVDYVIVGTSLKDPSNPLLTSQAKVRELRDKMTALRP